MRILFVAMPESIHTARWISQVSSQGWDIFLFPALRAGIHPQVKNVNYFNPDAILARSADHSVRVFSNVSSFFYLDALFSRLKKTQVTTFREKALALCIQSIKPDLVHSLEMQLAGYMTLASRKAIGNKFPAWMVSIWGSDIYLFGRLRNHQERVKAVLRECNYYLCECERDVPLAQNLGLQGKIMPHFPGQGGFRSGICQYFAESPANICSANYPA